MQIADIINHKQPNIYQELITRDCRAREKKKINLDTWEEDASVLHSNYRGIMEQKKGVNI